MMALGNLKQIELFNFTSTESFNKYVKKKNSLFLKYLYFIIVNVVCTIKCIVIGSV